MDKKQNQTHPEVGEDATQYGEFISTYFAWIPLPDQKEKAGEMAKMTEKEKNAKQNRHRMHKKSKMEPALNAPRRKNK